MTTMVAGVYRQGKLELLEEPLGLREGAVRVLLVQETDNAQTTQPLVFGKYAAGQMSSLEDFSESEWRGESTFEENDGE